MRRTNRIISLVLARLAQYTVSSAATAQQTGPPCGPRLDVLSRFLSDYGERPVALGLLDYGNLLEVLASPGGSWTLLVTFPDRLTCFRASGVAWEMDRRPRPPADERRTLSAP
jgi:hypothetical protein